MPTKNLSLAIEIGGTKLQAATGTSDGTILNSVRGAVDPQRGPDGILDWISKVLPVLIAEAETPPTAIGVGFGGPVDSATGNPITSHQVSGWDNVPLRPWLEERFGLPVSVHNDANAAGWAEYKLGAGRGTEHFVYMNIGSGIGGALVLNAKLHNGQGLGACEIGHTLIPDWIMDSPRVPVKLEDRCSGWNIEQRIRGWQDLPTDSPLAELCNQDPTTLSCAMLGEAARRNDPLAIAEIDQIAAGIAVSLANVVTLLHPERIAVGGGVGLMGETLLSPLRVHLNHLVFGPYRGRYELVPCVLEESVVIVGALMLAHS